MSRKPRRVAASKPVRARRRWLRWLVLLVLLLALVPQLLILSLRWFDPPTSAFMQRERWLHNRSIDQVWVPIESLPSYLPLAIVASEDQRFPEHFGFDLDSIRNAIRERQAGEGSRGASTLSQQVAKNLFLWPGQSWIRKGVEAWLTLGIETLWPKRRVLEVYLNIAEFGPGIFGVEAAARHHFNRSAAALSLEQASLLAVVLPNPKRMDAGKPSAYVRERAAWVRRQMQQLGGDRYLERILAE